MQPPRTKIGLDIVDVLRFAPYKHDRNHHFLQKVFLQSEIDYCFSYDDPTTHLAGIFSAKEAVSKALGTQEFPFIEIEIRHDGDGRPEAWKDGKILAIAVSISHTDTISCAIAAT